MINHCRICGNDRNNRTIEAREMMLGTGERFDYLECAHCGCLQICEVPDDLGRYYPANYYSYARQADSGLLKASAFRQTLLAWHLKGRPLAGRLGGLGRHYPWVRPGTLTRHARILDVGCGTGALLLKMHADGFGNLTGVDPYLDQDIRYRCGVTIHRKALHELDGPYDLIMLHHSFEHMAQPRSVLKDLRQLLQPDGEVVLRLPLADSHAFRKYGAYWVQFDAPRHLFLHTARSIAILCVQAGFRVEKVQYDSGTFQFTGSEQYLRGLPMVKEQEVFSRQQRHAFRAEAQRLNAIRDGDSACFHLRRRI